MDIDKEAAGFERIVPRHASLDRIACRAYLRRRAGVECSSNLSLMGRYRGRYDLEMNAGHRDLDLSSTLRESQRHDL